MYFQYNFFDLSRKCISKKNFLTTTFVNFDNLTEECIDDYINTDEPYDKAGAYAIQGYFAKYIEKIEGDYYNVMGLPINKLSKILDKIN